ncbi:MAG: hypothetical protein Q4F31_07690 [Eubacteriales bacterium]|nr:hypothetical protein [Eubacteriales bacterium]
MKKHRDHRVQVWLSDAEYKRLNSEVAKTHFSRETFLRLLIDGNTVMECPKAYTESNILLRKIHGDLSAYRFAGNITQEQWAKIQACMDRLTDVLHMMQDIYFPYFTWKKAHTKQVIGFSKLNAERTDNTNIKERNAYE